MTTKKNKKLNKNKKFRKTRSKKGGVKTRSGKETIIDCSICYEPMINNLVTTKPCNHTFHQDCLRGWCKSKTDTTCPLCRENINDLCKEINPPHESRHVIHTFYEHGHAEAILRDGNVGDFVDYTPNNQMGVMHYIIEMDENGDKYLNIIGDYEGYYDDTYNEMLRIIGGNKQSNKSKKKMRKTRSKSGGEGSDIKLAILLITTHGNIDSTEEETKHEEDINVYKINVTTPGVCNFIEDDELLNMGNKISNFIKLIKQDWKEKGILTSTQNMDLTFKSHAISQQQLTYLTQSLRSFLPRIDGVYKEIVKTTKSKKVNIELKFFDEEDENDIDLEKYRTNVDKAYKMYKWKQGDEYLDKTYTIFPEERVDTTSNPYNNTVLIMSEPGMLDSDIVNMPYNLRSNVNKKWNDDDDNEDDKNNYMRLSEILENLVQKGYTDTIIIDLSCSSGWGERDSRALRRNKIEKYGGYNKKKSNKKKSNKKK